VFILSIALLSFIYEPDQLLERVNDHRGVERLDQVLVGRPALANGAAYRSTIPSFAWPSAPGVTLLLYLPLTSRRSRQLR
jgi:hypothetical protein